MSRLRHQKRQVLALERTETSDSRSDKRGRYSLERLVEQRQLVPTASARPSATSFCWPPLSSSALRSRISVSSRHYAVDEFEPRLAVEISATQTGSRMFSSTVSCGTRQRSSGM